jgi:transketolase
VLTRQALPQQLRSRDQGLNIARGGYVLIESPGGPATLPEAIVIATGSEVAIAVAAVNALNAAGPMVHWSLNQTQGQTPNATAALLGRLESQRSTK